MCVCSWDTFRTYVFCREVLSAFGCFSSILASIFVKDWFSVNYFNIELYLYRCTLLNIGYCNEQNVFHINIQYHPGTYF